MVYACFTYFETLSFSFGGPTAEAIAVTGEVHRQWISLIIITLGNGCLGTRPVLHVTPGVRCQYWREFILPACKNIMWVASFKSKL